MHILPKCTKRRKKMMRTLYSFVTLALASSLALGADWPQWGGRPMRNMYSPEKSLPDSFGKVEFKPGTEEVDAKSVKNLKWAAKLGSLCYGNVTIASGKVFFG